MNALASSPGWRDLAIWVMPSALYALASDTLIGVIRAWALARKQHASQALAPDDEATPIAVLGGLLLWLLRLALGPALDHHRVPPAGSSRNAPSPPAAKPPAPATRAPHATDGRPLSGTDRGAKPPGKQARMIALAAQRHDLPRSPSSRCPGSRTPSAPRWTCPPAPPGACCSTTSAPSKTATRRRATHADEARHDTILILIAVAAVLLTAVKWAFLPFLPYRRLPRNRVRHLRLRLHLRLHPGAGHATVARAVAALGPVRRLPPQRPRPPVADLLPARPRPAQRRTRSASAGRTTGTGCGCRWMSTRS